ncbi:MAG: SPOR domain-containing protein [Treponema sp.]|nr:SPOR domain-containing protein [Treponema sp.]
MRRFIFSLLIISFVATMTFATSKPSLDGRAVVADEGVLPVGLFAKTVGYLPGDSVSVTNPSTGITINVLILGSIDPSAGVAILLSPEAADKLFITPNSNTQVKITKRTGMLDEAGSGTGTLVADTPTDTLLPNQMKNNLDSRLGSLDETLGTATNETSSATEGISSEENSSALAPSAEETTPEQAVPEQEIQAVSPDYAITAIEEVPMNHVLSEHDPVYIVESLNEDPFTGFETEAEPSAEASESTQAEEAETSKDAMAVISDETEMAPSDEWPSLEDTMFADEYFAAADSSLVDPFAPIILVPTEEHPPEEEVKEAVEPASTQEEPSETVPEPEDATPLTIVPEPVKSAVTIEDIPYTTLGTPEQRALMKSLSQLESGKYYVQVATFAEQKNIDRMLNEYGSKYPFVMVPLKSGRAIQMMIGPLNVDEYGAILARFKNLGFKDSFLRKIR